MASVLQLLLLLSCSYYSLRAHAGHEQKYRVLATSSLKPKAVCSNSKVISSSSRGSVLLNHRHGPCSPVPSKNKPSMAELLRRDALRTDYIGRKFSKNGAQGLEQSEVTVPTNLGYSLGTLEYVISVSIGTPSVPQVMTIDTGSDVSWVQCKPCPIPPCHVQQGSLFDPNESSTYGAFSCGSAPCKQLGDEGNGCLNSRYCQYIVTYGDGSNTTGTYSCDTLTLTSSDVVPGFQFGCSHAEGGLEDQTDGLMGLGGGPQSLVSQTAGKYGQAFSYCLPPSPDTSGFLKLGAQGSDPGFAFTTMLRSRRAPTFYGALLKAITVSGQQLNVSSSVFAGGSVIDSGTIITRLPPTAYAALRSAFKSEMKMYPPAPQRSILDTCFNFTGYTNITLPSVALVFDGEAVVDLVADGIMYGNCLAFAATDSDSYTGFIGNVQQRSFEVLYDVGSSTVGFRPAAC